jgi:uncharacterized protein (DUF302 family)
MYGQHITIAGPFAQAIDKVTAALKQEGFGVLSDIDIQKAMQEKLGVAMPGYRILGACNPPLAHRALQAEPEIGLLLPCNVTVRADTSAEGTVIVDAMDPKVMVQVSDQPGLQEVADEAAAKLRAAIDALAAGDGG